MNSNNNSLSINTRWLNYNYVIGRTGFVRLVGVSALLYLFKNVVCSTVVTGLNKWIAVFSVGIVCTFYTTIVSFFSYYVSSLSLFYGALALLALFSVSIGSCLSFGLKGGVCLIRDKLSPCVYRHETIVHKSAPKSTTVSSGGIGYSFFLFWIILDKKIKKINRKERHDK